MRVCLVNAFYDPEIGGMAELARRYYHLHEVAGALHRRGHEACVIQLFREAGEISLGPVRHIFGAPPPLLRWTAESAARLTKARQPARFVPATCLLSLIEKECPDALHFFGITLDLNFALVGRWASRKGLPLFATYHGGAPSRHWLRRGLQRGNLRRAAKLMFTTREHARPWVESGLLDGWDKVATCVETSSFFVPAPRREARRATGMTGAPVFLSAGRLDPLKDPITTLEGFATIQAEWPEARLHMVYLSGEMLDEVRGFLDARPGLAKSVQLLGRVPFEKMPDYFNSADFLIQSSLREIGGNAVLEAMACGAVPVLSDIPSHRAMTGEGAHGILFPTGDAAGLAAAVLRHGPPDGESRKRTRKYFEEFLSYDRIAETYATAYRDGRRDGAEEGS